MQYTSLVLCGLSAAFALAGPTAVTPPKNVTSEDTDIILVSLIHLAADTDEFSEIIFKERHLPDYNSPAESSGPFNIVQLNVTAGVQKQDLRCSVLDEFLEPIVVVRGENVDITFSDQDQGPWVLRDGETDIVAVVCDESFVAVKPGTSSSSSSSATTKPSPTSSSSSAKSSYSYSASSTTSKASTSSTTGYSTKSSATATSSAF